MIIRNTGAQFGIVSRLLHWLLAGAMLTLIPLGWYLTQLDNETVRYWRLLELHETIGLVLFIFLLFKLAWKFTSPNPAPVPGLAPWERKLARVVHSYFLFAFVIIPVSGYIFVASGNDPIELYRVIVLPALDPISKSTSDLLYNFHFYGAYSCTVLVLVHIIAALKHHIIDKNDVLRRMKF